MADVRRNQARRAAPGRPRTGDWDSWYARARLELQRRLFFVQSLLPRDTAEVVAECLPQDHGRWLLERLERRGWLGRQARVPCDALDGDRCPPEFRFRGRDVVRLAVFGLPGQGRPDYKHREATLQTLCAQVTRESGSLSQFTTAASRALSHPEVSRDPVLAAMLRSYLAEREQALRTSRTLECADGQDESKLQNAFSCRSTIDFPTRTQVLKAYYSLRHEFEVYLAEWNETAARYALERIQDLGRRYPAHLRESTVSDHTTAFESFSQRCRAFREQIESVAAQAAQAAADGETKTSTWLLRRLRAIHALTPALLSADRFETLRGQIEASGQQADHRAALRELIAREREVADNIKRAAAAIYRFHRLAEATTPDPDAYARAEKAYKQAVEVVRTRDTEWLTGLLLELEAYLDDLNDPQGQAEAQLDRFIETVRTALMQLRREIRQIHTTRERPIS